MPREAQGMVFLKISNFAISYVQGIVCIQIDVHVCVGFRLQYYCIT